MQSDVQCCHQTMRLCIDLISWACSAHRFPRPTLDARAFGAVFAILNCTFGRFQWQRKCFGKQFRKCWIPLKPILISSAVVQHFRVMVTVPLLLLLFSLFNLILVFWLLVFLIINLYIYRVWYSELIQANNQHLAHFRCRSLSLFRFTSKAEFKEWYGFISMNAINGMASYSTREKRNGQPRLIWQSF